MLANRFTICFQTDFQNTEEKIKNEKINESKWQQQSYTILDPPLHGNIEMFSVTTAPTLGYCSEVIARYDVVHMVPIWVGRAETFTT